MMTRVVFFMMAMLVTQTFGSIFFEDFNAGCTDEDRDIPNFILEGGVFIAPKCDTAARMGNTGMSARVLSPPGLILNSVELPSVSASLGISESVIAGQSYTISFYIKTGTTLAAYPFTVRGTYGVNPMTITRDLSVPGNADGWFKYTGTFTVPVVRFVLPAGTRVDGYYIGLIFERTRAQAAVTATQNIWMDNFRLDLQGFSGDPQFVGLRGQSYQVHGIDGAVYNLVSSPNTQVNSRFVFLDEGKCPIFNGIPAKNCWAHSGSYMGEIGIQQVVNGVTHKVSIVSGSSTDGFASVVVDGKQLSVNDTVEDTSLFDITFAHSHTIMVNTEDFAFTLENSDMFINQGVFTNKRLSQLTSHGLFGQTHKQAIYPTSIKYIEGDVDDYMVAEDDLFGVSFVYNKFTKK